MLIKAASILETPDTCKHLPPHSRQKAKPLCSHHSSDFIPATSTPLDIAYRIIDVNEVQNKVYWTVCKISSPQQKIRNRYNILQVKQSDARYNLRKKKRLNPWMHNGDFSDHIAFALFYCNIAILQSKIVPFPSFR